MLYSYFIKLLTNTKYGEDGEKFALFIPNSECTFFQVLDCVKVAFYSNNRLMDLITRIEEERTASLFENIFLDEFYENEEHLKDACKNLFKIIQEYKRKSSEGIEQDFLLNQTYSSRLIRWAYHFAQKYIFFVLLSS